MNKPLDLIHQLDASPSISRTKSEKPKSRRERRRELRDRLKSAKTIKE